MTKEENTNLQLEKVSLWPAIFLCLIQLGAITDNTALLNASSAIADTFRTDISQIQIANIMYPLMAGGIMVAGGFLGKIIGWKRLVQIGLLVFIIGEILVVISPTITIFVYVARGPCWYRSQFSNSGYIGSHYSTLQGQTASCSIWIYCSYYRLCFCNCSCNNRIYYCIYKLGGSIYSCYTFICNINFLCLIFY